MQQLLVHRLLQLSLCQKHLLLRTSLRLETGGDSPDLGDRSQVFTGVSVRVAMNCFS